MDSNGRNALHLAAMIGHVPMVKLAVEQWHLSPLQPDTWDHWTPLHYATKEGNLEIVRYLWRAVQEKSSIQASLAILALKDRQGRTIMDLGECPYHYYICNINSLTISSIARQWRRDDIVTWLASLQIDDQ
jgi:hypothetical protein